MEEEAKQQKRNPSTAEQERRDAEMARRVAGMDLKATPIPVSSQQPYSSASIDGDSKPRALPTHGRRHSEIPPASSIEYNGGTGAATHCRRVTLNDYDAVNQRPQQFHDSPKVSSRSGSRSRAHSSGGGGSGAARPSQQQGAALGEKLEYARRLQENAFSSLHRRQNSGNNTEESDLELAIRMQQQEHQQNANRGYGQDPNVRSVPLMGSNTSLSSASWSSVPTQTRPKGRASLEETIGDGSALATFMAESGTSFSDMSTDFLNDLMGVAGTNSRPGNAGNPVPPPASQQERSTKTSPNGPWGHSSTRSGDFSTATNGSSRSAVTATGSRATGPSSRYAHSSQPESRESPRVSAHPVAQPVYTNSPITRSSQNGQTTNPSVASPAYYSGTTRPANVSSATEVIPVRSTAQATSQVPHPQQSAPPSKSEESTSPPSESHKPKRKGQRRRSFLSFGRSSSGDNDADAIPGVPGDIPPPPKGVPGAIPDAPPLSVAPAKRPTTANAAFNGNTAYHHQRRASAPQSPLTGQPQNGHYRVSPQGQPTHSRRVSAGAMPGNLPLTTNRGGNPGGRPMGNNSPSVCAVCYRTSGPFLAALDRKYHPECFRCKACNEQIDPYGQFKVKEDERGRKTPYHRECHAKVVGIQCTVCRHRIPVSSNGTVEYVKHPFFDKELMCRRHAKNQGRVCAGCRRFEPVDRPFIDLSDAQRCVCPSCFRSVVVDHRDIPRIWESVLSFFEHYLKLPVWNALRDTPVLLVGADALNDQLSHDCSVHCGAKQLMCAAASVTDRASHGRRFKLPTLRYEKSTGSFESLDDRAFYEIPSVESSPSAVALSAILCLCGLPRDLTATVLAHEATHAWLKLHPNYRQRLPPEVEEGCAQLVAMLFLTHGLGPASRTSDADGPSDEQLRQYYKFCIERDSTDMYGASYRRAAKAYRDIGIEALLSHVLHYGGFPHT